MSHQVRANGVHQIDTGSNSVPVLGLRPLSKSLRVHQGQPPPPPGTLELLWWDRESSGRGQQSSSGPNRPRFSCVKGGHCTEMVVLLSCAGGKMACAIEPHNSAFLQVCLDLLKTLPWKSAPSAQAGNSQLTPLQGTSMLGWGHQGSGGWG